LHGCNRLYGMSAADRFSAGFGESKVPDLAFLGHIPHCSGNLFNWHIGIDPVLIEQVNGVNPQAPERCFGNPPDLLRLTIESG